MADCLNHKKDLHQFFSSKAYLNLYLLQKTIFGNVALSTGVVFEISVVDTVASWYVLSVLKKIGMVMLFQKLTCLTGKEPAQGRSKL